MFHLRAGDSISAVMSGAAATTNPSVIVHQEGPLTTAAALTGTTAVTLASGLSTREVSVKTITVSNVDTQANTVTLSATLGGVTLNFAVLAMQAGDSFTVNDDGTISGVNSAGQALTQITGGPTVTQAPGASTAALGTTNADAAALPAGTSAVYPTTGANDSAGVIINSADKVTGRMLFIGNGVSNKICKVYAPSGGVINGASANAAFSSASGKGVIIVCLSGSGNTWLAW